MLVRDLKRIAAALPPEDDDMVVEFDDVTTGRHRPINGWAIKSAGPQAEPGVKRLALTNAFEKGL